MVNPNGRNGTLMRGFHLGKLGFSLVGSYLGYQAQNVLLGEAERPLRQARFQQRVSQRARAELGNLKGPAMKLGQMLSLGGGLLHPEALEELANLQRRAPGMHASLARAQFKSTLGKYPEELLREFDPEPFAAASLGQVHRGLTRNGEKVAIKIQYPAIRTAIENDFKLFQAVTLPTRITGHIPAALVAEVERGLLEETDYLQEAQNVEFFRTELRELTYLSIPRVYPELSGDRVLTMSFIEGISLEEFLRRKPSAEMRDLVGHRLAQSYYTQLHRLKALHADQHPGNYFFRPDGCIGLVDFGCVKRTPSGYVGDCHVHRGPFMAPGRGEASTALGLIVGPQIPYRRARKLLPLLERSANFLFPQGPAANPVVDFRDPALLKLAESNSKQLFRDRLYPPEFALCREPSGTVPFVARVGRPSEHRCDLEPNHGQWVTRHDVRIRRAVTSGCRAGAGAGTARPICAIRPNPPRIPPPSRCAPPGPPAFAARARIFCPRRA